LRAFSIVGVLADANGFGKPDNNIATADAPSKPVRSRRREARLISRVSREKRAGFIDRERFVSTDMRHMNRTRSKLGRDDGGRHLEEYGAVPRA
jgi:hypothetical protein